MRVLLDECVRRDVAALFPERFVVETVASMGWLQVRNGELVRLADERFEALFTVDANMPYQTSLRGLALRVAVARGAFRETQDYAPAVARFSAIADELPRGEFTWLANPSL